MDWMYRCLLTMWEWLWLGKQKSKEFSNKFRIKSEQIIEQLRINALSTLMMTKIAFSKF